MRRRRDGSEPGFRSDRTLIAFLVFQTGRPHAIIRMGNPAFPTSRDLAHVFLGIRQACGFDDPPIDWEEAAVASSGFLRVRDDEIDRPPLDRLDPTAANWAKQKMTRRAKSRKRQHWIVWKESGKMPPFRLA